jgi:hypothetical protein
MKAAVIALSVMCSLSGCASDEYKRAASQCEPEAYKNYPVMLQQQVRTEIRYELVDSGQVTCSSSGITTYSGNTGFTTGSANCQAQKIPKAVEYQVTDTVDVNKRIRNAQISECAMRTCIQQYGAGDKCKNGF